MRDGRRNHLARARLRGDPGSLGTGRHIKPLPPWHGRARRLERGRCGRCRGHTVMTPRYATHQQRYPTSKPRPTREQATAFSARAAAAQHVNVQRNPHPRRDPQHGVWQAAYDAERVRLGRPVAQARAMATAPARRMPGARRPALAALAGMLCSNPAFQAWSGVGTPEEAAAWVRRVCGVQSRSELDTNTAAAQAFEHKVRRPWRASRDS